MNSTESGSHGVSATPCSMPHLAARQLEEFLGDPNDARTPFSFSRCLACDEAEVYPQEAEDAIRSWGAAEYLIPSELGGRLGHIEQAFELIRSVARRDLTVAVGFGANLLAALPVWIAGTDCQRQFISNILRAGEGLALAVTERGHGSDLLANTTRVERSPSGLTLTGEKWLISNATKARAVVVFARTRPAGGPRGFSLFLLDKRTLPAGHWDTTPRVPTGGLRGADVSGLRFRGCPIPDESRLGTSGDAFETVHRTLTVTKTLCGAMALGAADTALQVVTKFATRRQLYGGRASDIPHVRSSLIGTFLDILACECVVRAATRALGRPGEPTLFWSALVKYFVPTMVERILHSLAVVLGARMYLREGPESVFQKIVRDASIVSVFEGSTVVNLGILVSQLAHRTNEREETTDEAEQRVIDLYSPLRHCSGMKPATLGLRSLQSDPAVANLPEPCEAEAILRSRPVGSPAIVRSITSLLSRLKDRIRTWNESYHARAEGRAGNPRRQPARLLDLAADYCRLHTAAACWQTWKCWPPADDSFVGRGDWLTLCLRRLMSRPGPSLPTGSATKRVFAELTRRIEEGQPFSLFSE